MAEAEGAQIQWQAVVSIQDRKNTCNNTPYAEFSRLKKKNRFPQNWDEDLFWLLKLGSEIYMHNQK